MWCFFALNYSTRRRNQTSGQFFVDGFDKDAPESMDELKDRLRKGDMSFIDKITYYSQRLRGSSSYWRSRQAELYSWINHHVKEGNGMPNFFITLSCAEYFWPDVLVVARIPAMSGMCSWKALVIGERVPGRPQMKNGTPCLRYLFVLLGTKHFTLRIR
jgi:hypothetical protein